MARALFLGALALALMPNSRAQTVGQIEEMRDSNGQPQRTASEVRLTLAEQYTEKPAQVKAFLHVGEIIEIKQPYFVRANLTNTEFFIGSSGERIGTLTLSDRGFVQIRQSTVCELTDEEVEIFIKHGVVVLNNEDGEIAVSAENTCVIVGSTVLFATDSTSTTAVLFLKQGHIAFPDHPEMDVEEEEDLAWRLRDGFPPERWVLSGTELLQFRQAVDFNSHTVWRGGRRPLWQRPEFFIPVGAAVVVTSILLLTSGSGDDTLSGVVAISL